jgi:hypothetical protein
MKKKDFLLGFIGTGMFIVAVFFLWTQPAAAHNCGYDGWLPVPKPAQVCGFRQDYDTLNNRWVSVYVCT